MHVVDDALAFDEMAMFAKALEESVKDGQMLGSDDGCLRTAGLQMLMDLRSNVERLDHIEAVSSDGERVAQILELGIGGEIAEGDSQAVRVAILVLLLRLEIGRRFGLVHADILEKVGDSAGATR